MCLFLIEASKITIQTLTCSHPRWVAHAKNRNRRTDKLIWRQISLLAAFTSHRDSVASLQHCICTGDGEKWDRAGLHTTETSLALEMSRTLSVSYLKLVLHLAVRKIDSRSEKYSAA